MIEEVSGKGGVYVYVVVCCLECEGEVGFYRRRRRERIFWW